MKRRLLLSVLTIVTAGGWLITCADESKMSGNLPLPQPVRAAVEKTLPGWQVVRVEFDKKLYRIKLEGPEGDARIRVSSDGLVRSVEQDLLRAELQEKLPDSVRKAIAKAFPNRKLNDAVKVTRIEVSYRVAVGGDSGPGAVTVNADGKILEVEKK